MNDYTVYFRHEDSIFGIRLENQETMEDIADALVRALLHEPPLKVGRAAADFLYWAAQEKRSSLLNREHVATTGTVIDVDFSPGGQSCVVRVYDAENCNHRFVGGVMEFKAWTKPNPLVDKIVIFRYLGGSSVGNRVVKITQVQHKLGTTYYCGKDLRKGEFRCYNLKNIDGEILVLGEDESVSPLETTTPRLGEPRGVGDVASINGRC